MLIVKRWPTILASSSRTIFCRCLPRTRIFRGGLMNDHEEIIDSSVGWVAKHVHRYVETDGKEGQTYQGVQSLLLTTRGRKSGKLYRTALYYGQDGDRYLLVPSNGGSDEHPSWYLNLVENPQAEVQVGAEKFSARA